MSAEKLQDHLAYPPRAFRAERAAAYLAMSVSTFFKLVDEKLLPKGVKVKGVTMWDRYDLDAAFDDLKERSERAHRNPIEEHFGVGNRDDGTVLSQMSSTSRRGAKRFKQPGAPF